MTFQTFKNEQNNRGETKRTDLKNEICSTWLGWRDSNPRMLVPKTSALPLGDIPKLGSGKIISWQPFRFNGVVH